MNQSSLVNSFNPTVPLGFTALQNEKKNMKSEQSLQNETRERRVSRTSTYTVALGVPHTSIISHPDKRSLERQPGDAAVRTS